jgi:hypothetical protein
MSNDELRSALQTRLQALLTLHASSQSDADLRSLSTLVRSMAVTVNTSPQSVSIELSRDGVGVLLTKAAEKLTSVAAQSELIEELTEQCVQLSSTMARRCISVFERGSGAFDRFSFTSVDANIGVIDVTLSKRYVAVSEIGAMVWMGGLLLASLFCSCPRFITGTVVELGSGE